MKLQLDALRSQLIQKQVENMDHYKIMDMHAPFYHEINSQLNNTNMHEWIMLYYNMLALIHGSILNLTWAIQEQDEQEGNYSTLGLQCKIRSSIKQSTLQLPSKSTNELKLNSILSHSLFPSL